MSPEEFSRQMWQQSQDRLRKVIHFNRMAQADRLEKQGFILVAEQFRNWEKRLSPEDLTHGRATENDQP